MATLFGKKSEKTKTDHVVDRKKKPHLDGKGQADQNTREGFSGPGLTRISGGG